MGAIVSVNTTMDYVHFQQVCSPFSHQPVPLQVPPTAAQTATHCHPNCHHSPPKPQPAAAQTPTKSCPNRHQPPHEPQLWITFGSLPTTGRPAATATNCYRMPPQPPQTAESTATNRPNMAHRSGISLAPASLCRSSITTRPRLAHSLMNLKMTQCKACVMHGLT